MTFLYWLLHRQIRDEAKLIADSKRPDIAGQTLVSGLEILDQTKPSTDILPQIITVLKVLDNQNDDANPPTSSQSSQ